MGKYYVYTTDKRSKRQRPTVNSLNCIRFCCGIVLIPNISLPRQWRVSSVSPRMHRGVDQRDIVSPRMRLGVDQRVCSYLFRINNIQEHELDRRKRERGREGERGEVLPTISGLGGVAGHGVRVGGAE